MSEQTVTQDVFDALLNVIAERVADKLKERNAAKQPEPLPDNTTFNLEEAAKFLNCSTAFVRNRLKSKEIHGFKSGGKWLIYKRELDKWIANGGSA